MPHAASPQQIVNTLMQRIALQEWQELHLLYAEDAIIEYPFALPAPRRLEGREAIRQYFIFAAAVPMRLVARDMRFHETSDREVVIAEWDYDGLVTTTGQQFQVSNIQVCRVRDGTIVSSRDYHNHTVMTAAAGRLPALVAALGKVFPA